MARTRLRLCLSAPLIAALVAGCGGPPVANEQEVEAVTNGVEPLPPPAQPSASPEPGVPAEPNASEPPPTPAADASNAIPARFQGRYASDDRGCARRGSEGQLVVDPGGLRFFESVGAVTHVETLDDGAIRVAARYSGEGETWTADHRLVLSQGGAFLAVTGADGNSVLRKRCAG